MLMMWASTFSKGPNLTVLTISLVYPDRWVVYPLVIVRPLDYSLVQETANIFLSLEEGSSLTPSLAGFGASC